MGNHANLGAGVVVARASRPCVSAILCRAALSRLSHAKPEARRRLVTPHVFSSSVSRFQFRSIALFLRFSVVQIPCSAGHFSKRTHLVIVGSPAITALSAIFPPRSRPKRSHFTAFRTMKMPVKRKHTRNHERTHRLVHGPNARKKNRGASPQIRKNPG